MPLLNVYNHLLQGHILMRQTRFDAHKKAELRDIYQNIMRLTSEQPLYKLTFNDDAQAFTLGLKTQTLSLSSMLKELHVDDGTSVFYNKALESDQPNVVTVSASDSSDTTKYSDPLCVQVFSIATSQKNEGSFVPASASDLPKGQYNFTAGVDDNLYSFQFNVSEGSTHLELLNKLSDFINKSSIGLKTNVNYNSDLGLVRLELTSTLPGTISSEESTSFTLSDTKRPQNVSKGIIDYFDLNHVSVAPLNTRFTLNNIEHSTRGTRYALDNDVTLSFLQVCQSPVTISVKSSSTPVKQKLSAFLDCYNSTLNFIRSKSTSYSRSKRLVSELNNITKQYSDRLSKQGILVEADGSLTLNDEIVTSAIADNSLESFFTSTNGFASTLLKKLSDITINPMEYLNKTIVTYPNTSIRKPYNPYITSIYSGLLYNNYC